MSFSLDARLSRDTDFVGDLPLCRVLLMNDSRGRGSFWSRGAKASSNSQTSTRPTAHS